MKNGPLQERELEINAHTGSGGQPDTELRRAVHKIVTPLSHSLNRREIKSQIVSGGESALRMIISVVEAKFEKGMTDLEGDAQKRTLLACRDICLTQKINQKLLEKLECTVCKMGSTYERAELLNLLGEQLAKGKLPGVNPGRTPGRIGAMGKKPGTKCKFCPL